MNRLQDSNWQHYNHHHRVVRYHTNSMLCKLQYWNVLQIVAVPKAIYTYHFPKLGKNPTQIHFLSKFLLIVIKIFTCKMLWVHILECIIKNFNRIFRRCFFETYHIDRRTSYNYVEHLHLLRRHNFSDLHSLYNF